jgi:hypothetical protein
MFVQIREASAAQRLRSSPDMGDNAKMQIAAINTASLAAI